MYERELLPARRFSHSTVSITKTTPVVPDLNMFYLGFLEAPNGRLKGQGVAFPFL
jgi:hypothetical protein